MWLLVSIALAAPNVDLAAEADLHFREGVEDYVQGAYTGSVEHLLRSFRLVPNRNVAFNLGRAFEQLHQAEQAWRYYSVFLLGETQPDRRRAAEQALDRLAEQVARVTITSTPPGAVVYVDRQDLGPRGATPMLLPLPAGDHVLILEAPGFTDHRSTHTWTTGEQGEAHILLEPLAPGPQPEPSTDTVRLMVQEQEWVHIGPTGCQLLPGKVEATLGPLAPVEGLPAGGQLPTASNLTLVTEHAGQTWHHALTPAARRGWQLAAPAPLHTTVFTACDPGAPTLAAWLEAIAPLNATSRRAVAGWLGEWSVSRGTEPQTAVRSAQACARGDCTALIQSVTQR